MSQIAEIAALKAEIERLKVQIPRTKAEIERQQRITKIVSEHLWFYQSRAAAWKRCAKKQKHEINNLINYLEEIRCNSKDEFSVFIANEALLKSIYAENLSSSPEDKSALDEKPDSSES